MPRHSFVRIRKLTDVRGRVDYISNPNRQEHLYAVYSTVEPEFWEHLSRQAQFDFWRSNQKTGTCVESLELGIALPESLQQYDPEQLLKLFTETFRTKYGAQCTAALHHNKKKTNYHIHMIFSDRDLLEKKEVKIASRNMFFNEEGRHVRTKKEILDKDGKIRPGCRILPKGEPYEMRWFSGKNDFFKSKKFLSDAKIMYTDLINKLVDQEKDRLQVFDPAGPYLPTKKIGKNNPKEKQIRADNQLRQEWNRAVDQVLIAGGKQEDVTQFKQEEVVDKVAESVNERGSRPDLFSGILRRGIAVLKDFLEILMTDQSEKTEYLDTDQKPIRENVQKPAEKEKGPRPDSREAELVFIQVDAVHQKLNKCNRKLYALQKQKKLVQQALDATPKTLFHRKDRKDLENRIEGLDRQIEATRFDMEMIPKQNGFANVKEAEAAYRFAKKTLDEIHQAQEEWDGVKQPVFKIQTQKESLSTLKMLAAKRMEMIEREEKNNEKSHGKKEERKRRVESL